VLDLPGIKDPRMALSSRFQMIAPAAQFTIPARRTPAEIGRHDEVVVSEAFARAHAFKPGGTIDATIRGARERLRIVGIALSPEFVFETRAVKPFLMSAASVFLDERT
jgi:putative ABC transport system permease protein